MIAAETLRHDVEPVTTSGDLALCNLHAQIDGLTARVTSGQWMVTQRAELIDRLTLRGQMLGCIADYEWSAALAEQLVQDAPADPIAFLARARTQATFHRFDAALADLDVAEQLGADWMSVGAERATILQALGRYDEALAFHRSAAARQPGFATLAALAVLQAERGEVDEAEQLFGAGRQRYHGVSPFPLAQLDFQHGVMWLEQGDLTAARTWFDAAQTRVPAYTAAIGHLAEVDAAVGQHDSAISRLRPLTACSDNPEYAALLATLLSETGQTQEADWWRSQAAARYDELLGQHPAAFADHAAEFWLTAGGDPQRALELAGLNLATRRTPRAFALHQRAALASKGDRNRTLAYSN